MDGVVISFPKINDHVSAFDSSPSLQDKIQPLFNNTGDSGPKFSPSTNN